ncbi:MAG: SGNH/GDSL hydrolase family protein [Bacilli bacterium]|nr:SGNH/GDSL hydrolase family protein [Bacilli bacterium]
MNKIARTWVVIGDSFGAINEDPEAWTFGALKKGYVDRTIDKLSFDVKKINISVSGYQTKDWLKEPIQKGDFYTILLGTNDWWGSDIRVGDKSSYLNREPNTILGNLGVLIDRIRDIDKYNPIFVMNPVESALFVYKPDFYNNRSVISTNPVNGRTIKDIADAIYKYVRGYNIIPINLHDLSGITPANCVKFQRRMINGEIKDIPYPEYLKYPFDPSVETLYPYPEESFDYTYDGLHPTDKGSEVIAEMLAKYINEYYEE